LGRSGFFKADDGRKHTNAGYPRGRRLDYIAANSITLSRGVASDRNFSLVKIFACSKISLRVCEEYFSRWYAIALLEGKLSN
jgi:hypothetical protein